MRKINLMTRKRRMKRKKRMQKRYVRRVGRVELEGQGRIVGRKSVKRRGQSEGVEIIISKS